MVNNGNLVVCYPILQMIHCKVLKSISLRVMLTLTISSIIHLNILLTR